MAEAKTTEDKPEMKKVPEKDFKLERTLKYGMKGEDVQALQALLARKGYACEADGVFGMDTVMAVRRMQKSRKLPENGLVDATDIKALMKP